MSVENDIDLVETVVSEVAPAVLVAVLKKYAPNADVDAAKTALSGMLSNAIALEKAIAKKPGTITAAS